MLYLIGSNDTILSEVGQTVAVSLVGVHHGPEDALEHSFGTSTRGPATLVLRSGLV